MMIFTDAAGWTKPTAPDLVRPVEYVTVEQAALTTFEVKRVDDRRRSVSGAVYDRQGNLVAASQRSGGIGGDLVSSVDPESIAVPSGFNRVSGKWLYGGHWMGQFGHFITESLTTLWPRLDVDGIICHPFIFGTFIHPWQLSMVRRLGFRGPILIARQGCVVEELVVPERPFTLNASVAPEAVNAWNRVASPGSHHTSRVFLSRTKLTSDPRRVPGDERLDDLMTEMGFSVLHPQDMPVEDQLDAVAEAGVLAGVSGSALHLSAFAHPHCKVLEFGDARSPHRALPNQRVIDDAVGRQSGFIPYVGDNNGRNLMQSIGHINALLGS